MKKIILFLATTILLFACGKNNEISDACITSCPPSVPGKINLAIENHTTFDINNLTLTINGESLAFPLLPKNLQGSYSCWQSFDEVDLISSVEFNIGDTAIHQEIVNYENLSDEREFSIDISSISSGLRIQLMEAPGQV